MSNPFANEAKQAAAVDGDAEAQVPLLRSSAAASSFDLLALKDQVARRQHEEPVVEYDLLEMENLPAYMVVQSIVNAFMGVLIVLGAYWFVISAGDRITPLCKPYQQPHLPIYSFEKIKMKENLCYSSTYCFWTYPILCPLAMIWVNWKNLVDKRLFYECLLNRIFLLQSRASYLYSKTFWFLIGYGILALSSVFYMDSGMDQAPSGSLYWRYKEVVFGMLAYFSAVGAFLYKLFSQWSVNYQVISLSNYMYRDNHMAIDLMKKCTFVEQQDFEASWVRVEQLFEEYQEERFVPKLTTPELLQLTLEQYEKYKEYQPDFLEQVGNFFYWAFAPKKYWVTRLLNFEHLEDSRSWHFRFCIRFYLIFVAVSIALFCWGMFYTTSHYLLFQYKDLMPRDLDRMPAPHEAPAVYNQASRLIPRVVKTVKDHAF